jgi:hypothetical protein
MTASVTFSPRKSSAAFFSFWSTLALTSGGDTGLPRTSIAVSPFEARTALYGTRLISSCTSSKRRPTNRLALKMVFSGFVTAWRFAI